MNSNWIEVKIAARREEAADIVGLELVDPNGAQLPRFTAGSHIDVQVAPGLIRQYSLCGSPTNLHSYQLGILREAASRGGSAAAYDKLQVGDTLRISEPRNHFALDPNARHSILLGGGIGVTPLLSMAEHLVAAGASFELHYCTRSPSRTAFLGRLVGTQFADKITCHYDDGPSDQQLKIDSVLGSPVPDTHIYACGPGGFMEFVAAAARRLGWPLPQLHREYFSNAAVGTGTLQERPFTVQIASTGEEYEIPPDRSVVAVLAEAGVLIPVFCEQGTCGTCATRILEGIPDHRDVYLSEEERGRNDQFLPCCSRARGDRLVLEL